MKEFNLFKGAYYLKYIKHFLYLFMCLIKNKIKDAFKKNKTTIISFTKVMGHNCGTMA